MGVLSGLEPNSVFTYFEEICGIPHGSSDTKAISDYCVRFAKEHGLRYQQDASNNVIIWKEGTAGYEDSDPVMLQGHMDMVCEKEAGYEIDFARDGLELELEDGVISAKGTTLGGDDGIAVAYALAILASDDIVHPPLEVVLTVDEEIGMLGAAALDMSPLQARIMLNLDSEEEGYLLVSCAGGVTTTAHLPIVRETVQGYGITLRVTGLLGGHSGVEIDKGRANACQLLGRTLCSLRDTFTFQIRSIQGGLKDNAIPREAEVNLVLTGRYREGGADKESLVADFIERVSALQETYLQEYRRTDPGVTLLCETTGEAIWKDGMALTSTARLIAMLTSLPGGIQKMSFDIKGLVQTSLNLGILKSDEQEVSASFSIRSSVESEKMELIARIRCLMELLDGNVTSRGEYPAWEYRKESPLRELMVEVFREQYGREPVVQALHAGVECGLFAGKLPGLDCVSFGPDMKDIHTPKESMNVDSVRRVWEYTLEVLRRLA